MIDLATQTVFTLARANKHLPIRRGEKPVHPSTLFRWAKAGVRADDGTVVLLETIRVGRTLCTSTEALQRFCERLSSRPRTENVSSPTPVPSRANLLDDRRAAERGL